MSEIGGETVGSGGNFDRQELKPHVKGQPPLTPADYYPPSMCGLIGMGLPDVVLFQKMRQKTLI